MAAEIEIREVWASNVVAEISLIHKFLQQFPIISMDTEFPGTVFKPSPLFKKLPAGDAAYAAMKRNVDALHLIQLGLTLHDAAGNLPELGGRRCAWEFNFADFDSNTDPHNPESLSLLARQGVDFARNRLEGVDSRSFALLFKISGLGLRRRRLTWVTFHGAYDLGFMVKILTGRRLPGTLDDFLALLRVHLGPSMYDVKPVARALELHGGLERIARSLKVERAAGRSHQAGSDSLLTMQVFVELIKRFGEENILEEFNYVFFGLTEASRS
ncbi:probable CCR4-associated factor 1 homolog 11 [Salvia miltiorrhiza]|uniref:probable CCR4-associated factor 1 homolog 11 n=1 Tax=Salvia miltiorrhiza TaxID=226208 RepID=UPI0025ABD4FC|nr:probable CCR4-associated factor 1 homolog 11 [Salvia miltiorrhiza]